jgi:hypothetical protein
MSRKSRHPLARRAKRRPSVEGGGVGDQPPAYPRNARRAAKADPVVARRAALRRQLYRWLGLLVGAYFAFTAYAAAGRHDSGRALFLTGLAFFCWWPALRSLASGSRQLTLLVNGSVAVVSAGLAVAIVSGRHVDLSQVAVLAAVAVAASLTAVVTLRRERVGAP